METVRDFLRPLKDHFLRTAKAYVAGLVATLVAWFAARGVEVPGEVADAVVLIAVFVINYFLTWLVPNKS